MNPLQEKEKHTLLEANKLVYICRECCNDLCDGFYDDDDPLTLHWKAYCKDCFIFCKECKFYYHRKYMSDNRKMCVWCYDVPCDVKEPEK